MQCYLKEVENEKETLMASNNSLAEFNLTKEPELVEGREKIETLSQEGEELSKRVKELSEEFRKFFFVTIKVIVQCRSLHVQYSIQILQEKRRAICH